MSNQGGTDMKVDQKYFNRAAVGITKAVAVAWAMSSAIGAFAVMMSQPSEECSYNIFLERVVCDDVSNVGPAFLAAFIAVVLVAFISAFALSIVNTATIPEKGAG